MLSCLIVLFIVEFECPKKVNVHLLHLLGLWNSSVQKCKCSFAASVRNNKVLLALYLSHKQSDDKSSSDVLRAVVVVLILRSLQVVDEESATVSHCDGSGVAAAVRDVAPSTGLCFRGLAGRWQVSALQVQPHGVE